MIIDWQAVGLVTAASFAANVPLGYWRASLRKFSPAWFVAVHLSIPFIIYLRFRLGVSYLFIPFTLGLAVTGQLLGGLGKSRLSGAVDRTQHYG